MPDLNRLRARPWECRVTGLVLSLALSLVSDSEFPRELVAVNEKFRWAICVLLSIKTEAHQIIEKYIISISKFLFHFIIM